MASVPGIGAFDLQGLERLKQSSRENSPEVLKAAATQFEALFLNMVMKSMREAAASEGLFDSEQGQMMQGMLDQQYAQALAARGVGLAEVLVRQMTPRGAPSEPVAGPSMSPLSLPERAALQAANKAAVFAARLAPHAEAASVASGIPARFMIAQAALETGWGRREILRADGSPSHNLFGIKAGPGWKGEVAATVTTEYLDGVPRKRVEAFRAYGSEAEAFADYARLLSTSPRYRSVVAAASDAQSFADALQKAGYATDPAYAQKLKSVMAKV